MLVKCYLTVAALLLLVSLIECSHGPLESSLSNQDSFRFEYEELDEEKSFTSSIQFPRQSRSLYPRLISPNRSNFESFSLWYDDESTTDPLIPGENDSHSSSNAIVNYFSRPADVPVARIQAGFIITYPLSILGILIPIISVFTIIAEIGISALLIYCFQFYFGYYIRFNPVRLEEMVFNPEKGLCKHWIWAIVIPSLWLNIALMLFLPWRMSREFVFPLIVTLTVQIFIISASFGKLECANSSDVTVNTETVSV